MRVQRLLITAAIGAVLAVPAGAQSIKKVTSQAQNEAKKAGKGVTSGAKEASGAAQKQVKNGKSAAQGNLKKTGKGAKAAIKPKKP